MRISDWSSDVCSSDLVLKPSASSSSVGWLAASLSFASEKASITSVVSMENFLRAPSIKSCVRPRSVTILRACCGLKSVMRSPSHGHEACVCKIGLWTSGGSLRQRVECCRKEDDHRKDDDREKKGDLADRDEALSEWQVH